MCMALCGAECVELGSTAGAYSACTASRALQGAGVIKVPATEGITGGYGGHCGTLGLPPCGAEKCAWRVVVRHATDTS